MRNRDSPVIDHNGDVDPLRLLAVAAGTSVGMVMNFVGYSRFVFKTDEDQAA